MKVSIIIPAYNCANYIRRTIDSVKKQTYPFENLEVIIVNDGSTDATAEILAKYESEFTIIHTENKGVSHARNTGLKYATGKYIQYLDSDDLLVPDKIEVQVNALIKEGGDIAYGNWQKFTEDNGDIIISETVNRKIEGDYEIALFTDFWCPPAALLYSRRMVQKIGPWKEWLPIIQDARYFLDAALENGKFIYTNTNVALYRDGNPASLSKRENEFYIDCFNNARDVAEKWKVYRMGEQCEKKEAIIACLKNCINNFSRLSDMHFNECIDYLLTITPKYVPKQKGLFRIAVQLVGYRNAEKIGRYKRNLFR